MIFQSWFDEAESLAKGGGIDGDQGKEIREPYDSDEERQWNEKHKKNLKKYNIGKQNADVTEDDKELWQTLDELEVQEELDEYLEKEAKEDDNISIDEDEISDAGSNDWSESPDLSDDEGKKEVEDQTLNQNNEYQSLALDANKRIEAKPEHNYLLEKRAHATDKNSRENQEHNLTEHSDSSKLSPNTKLVGQVAVQQRTRRVSFGSISEYEYQRDDEYKTNKHEELTRHSWSENATIGTPGNIQHNMPEHDTSATQGKSISMAALAESLAQINAGQILSFGQNTTKTSPSTSKIQNPAISQPEVKISDTPQELEKSESESPQKTPTLFFTHFEEEEDELTSKVGRNEQNRSLPTNSDSTGTESCDHDFVYDSVPKNPADILRLYGFRRCSIDRPRLKGILKPSGSSHSLAEDSSLADDASVSDTSLAKSTASLQSSSGRFKISPTKIPDHVVNTLLSSSPINSTASLRSSPGGSRFSISPTKISDPSIFTPPEKPCVQTHHLSVGSGSTSRFSINRIDEQTFVPPTSLEKSGGVAKEKENVPVNAIVQEKSIPSVSSCVTESTEQVPKLVENPSEDADTCKNVHNAGQDIPPGKKESRFKASRGIKRAKEDKA